MIRTALLAVLLIACGVRAAHAEAGAGLAGIAPGPTDDARLAVAIGPHGEVYEPDGKGAWVRTSELAIAADVATVARGLIGVVVGGGGAIYRLAPNGWTAIRLAQKGKAIGGTGRRALAALGRDVFDLDRAIGGASTGGEPIKTATAAAAVTAIGGSVIITDRGPARLDHGKLEPIRNAPRLVPISDRWALTERGVFDLRAGKTIPWPGLTIVVADSADDVLVGVTTRDELVTVAGDKLVHAAIPLDKPGVPVGIVVDRTGRIAVAFRDGRIALREHDTWTMAVVEDRVPPAKPGAPPARSP